MYGETGLNTSDPVDGFGAVIGYLLADMIIYIILGWYLSHVVPKVKMSAAAAPSFVDYVYETNIHKISVPHPKELGARQPPWFVFTPKFLKSICKVRWMTYFALETAASGSPSCTALA